MSIEKQYLFGTPDATIEFGLPHPIQGILK
jgi:hypothetical protein